MDFLPKTANLQGGDTRKTPNLAYHAKHRRARVPSTHSLQSLPITAYHGIPSQSFLIQIPIGHGAYCRVLGLTVWVLWHHRRFLHDVVGGDVGFRGQKKLR